MSSSLSNRHLGLSIARGSWHISQFVAGTTLASLSSGDDVEVMLAILLRGSADVATGITEARQETLLLRLLRLCVFVEFDLFESLFFFRGRLEGAAVECGSCGKACRGSGIQ